MRTRWCRYSNCRQPFTPEKDFYYYCSWDCRVADVGPNYARDYRGSQRNGDQRYDRGYWDGTRARPSASAPEIPQGIWRGMVLFCHPDKWESEPGLMTLATEVTRWLLDHRPGGSSQS
jgi:hypothetical protein